MIRTKNNRVHAVGVRLSADEKEILDIIKFKYEQRIGSKLSYTDVVVLLCKDLAERGAFNEQGVYGN